MDTVELLLTSCQSSQQYSACLWNYQTKNALRTYKNGGTVRPKTLDVIGQDYVLNAELNKPLLHVWPLNSQEPDKTLKLILPGPATCLSVCPKSSYLAVGIENKLYVWQLCSGKLLSVQQRHYQPVTCVKFSSDGVYVIVTGEDGLLVVYFLADLIAIQRSLLSQSKMGQVEPVYARSDHSMPIRDAHVGNFGRKSRLATVSFDQTCRMYELSTGDLLLTLVFAEPIASVVFDAPCWQLYVGLDSGVISQYNLKHPPRTVTQHVEEDKSVKTFAGHKDKVTVLALNCTNTILASGSDDSFVLTWEINSRQVLQKLEAKTPITALKFVPNFENFFAQNLRPRTVVKSLGRNLETQGDNFTLSVIQDEDIRLSDDETVLEDHGYLDEILAENLKLKTTNYQLYKAALSLSKKYNK